MFAYYVHTSVRNKHLQKLCTSFALSVCLSFFLSTRNNPKTDERISIKFGNGAFY
jgi:hypothetical protein